MFSSWLSVIYISMAAETKVTYGQVDTDVISTSLSMLVVLAARCRARKCKHFATLSHIANLTLAVSFP